MPLKKASSSSKKSINKAVSENIHELSHHGTRKRSRQQIIAIAESAARGRSGKKKRK